MPEPNAEQHTDEGLAPVASGSTTSLALDRTERVALAVTVAALVGFGVYGFALRMPTTGSYLFTVSAVAALVVALRRHAVAPPPALALALLATAHLAGGLIRVGDDVLYNASLGMRAIRYDHFVHASGVFLGILVLWTFFAPPPAQPTHRRGMIWILFLAGLGLGAINETVEFLTTLAHAGANVGGYRNTGWDLVSNVVGAVAAGLWVSNKERAPGANRT